VDFTAQYRWGMSDEIGLDDAYSLKSASDVKRLYSRWADTFEEGFIVEHGYVYHRHVVEEFVRRADLGPAEAVLDVGCGTGVGGVELRRRGPWPVDGLDLSPEMLAKAADKLDGRGEPIYRHLFEANVLEPLVLGEGRYGGMVSIGTFTHGHVGPDAIDQLVSLVRPGGLLSLGINEAFYARADFGTHFDRMVTAGFITEPDLVQVSVYDPAVADHDHVDDTALVALFSPLE